MSTYLFLTFYFLLNISRLIAQPVKKFFHLVIPKHALVLDVLFFREILYYEDRLVGDLRLLDSEFKKFIFGSG